MSSSDLLTPLQAFKDYIGIKLHFQGDLVWRPDVRTKITETSLTNRKDAHFFYSIPKEFDNRLEYIEKLVSAFLWDRKFYIVDRRSPELADYHRDRMKRFSSLHHTFATEMESIVEYVEANKIILPDLMDTARKPRIIRDSRKIAGGVSLETLAILEYYFGFCSGSTSSDPLWAEKAFTISRYKYFCQPTSATNAKYERHIKTLIHESEKHR